MADILVPTLGESVSTATVARWLKQAGEAVTADEPLVELETDKVTVEVNAPSAGVIESISADTGAEVSPGAVLGVIGASIGAGAAPAPKAKLLPLRRPHRRRPRRRSRRWRRPARRPARWRCRGRTRRCLRRRR
jgi:2-oxoglutarate dehydrogenase E2 component (dihydrolipoamide succinyltransferase)